MDRVKIQELAYEIGVSNAVLIEKAKELGYDVTASNSTVTIEKAGILVEYVINGIKPKKAKVVINEGDDKVLKEDKNNKKELDKLGTKKQELHNILLFERQLFDLMRVFCCLFFVFVFLLVLRVSCPAQKDENTRF